MAFETILASGANAALPHARPGSKVLEHGDLIVVDYGVVLDGYCSDETCTFCLDLRMTETGNLRQSEGSS